MNHHEAPPPSMSLSTRGGIIGRAVHALRSTMAESVVAFTVVALLVWRVVRSLRLIRHDGRFRMTGLDPWIF